MEGLLKVRGVRSLDATLRALPVRVRGRILGAASLAMAKVGRHTARKLVRVKTGRLKRSIRVQRKMVPGPGGHKRKGAVLRAGAAWARHAHLIEFGSENVRTGRRNRAFPFVRPAVRRHHGRMIRAARGRIARLLPRAVKAAGIQT